MGNCFGSDSTPSKSSKQPSQNNIIRNKGFQ